MSEAKWTSRKLRSLPGRIGAVTALYEPTVVDNSIPNGRNSVSAVMMALRAKVTLETEIGCRFRPKDKTISVSRCHCADIQILTPIAASSSIFTLCVFF